MHSFPHNRLKHKQDMYPVFFITVGENCFTSSNPWEPFDMRTRTRMIAANFAICHNLKVGATRYGFWFGRINYVAKITAYCTVTENSLYFLLFYNVEWLAHIHALSQFRFSILNENPKSIILEFCDLKSEALLYYLWNNFIP